MPSIDLAQAILDMRKLKISDVDILAELRKGGYKGTALPGLEGISPQSSVEGTKQVITIEEATFEQRAANAGRVTEAQKTLEPAIILRELEKGVRK